MKSPLSLRSRADEAFRKLGELGGSDLQLCKAWNKFCYAPENLKRLAEFAKNEEFMKLYQAALWSTTVSTKRKTLQKFLEYVGKLPTDQMSADDDSDLELFR